jgi:hypothetical protein
MSRRGYVVFGQSELGQIASRLRVSHNDGIEAAQVKVIGLDEIRIAAGPRWPRMRERVRVGSLGILNQHTGPDDLVIPAGDGFLVILAEGAPEATQRRRRDMQDALLAFYLGEDALKSLKPDIRGQTLNADGLNSLLQSSMANNDNESKTRVHYQNIAFAPLYATHEKRVGPLLCAPLILERRQRRIGYDRDFIQSGHHEASFDALDLDIALLDESMARMEAARAAGKACAAGLSVHATTMRHRKAREVYLGWLDRADPELRRTLFMTIAEIEKGTPLSAIAEWSSALRAHAVRVWLEFHYSDRAIASIAGSGAGAAGFQWPQSANRGAREQISVWARALHNQNLRFFVHGFPDRASLEDAARLGVNFATCDALWPFEQNHDSVPPHAVRQTAPAGLS